MIRLRFRLRPRLGCSWAPLGLLLLCFWTLNWVQIGSEVDQEATQKWDPKLSKKMSQNRNPKWRYKLHFSGQNGPRAQQGFWAGCSLEVPCLPLGLSSPLRWPKSQILTPTCLKIAPKTAPRATFRPQFAPKLRLNLPRGGGFRGIYH